MRNYKLSLTADSEVTIDGLQADFVRVITASDQVEITPDNSQPLAGMRQGMRAKMPKAFKKLSFLSQSTQTVEVIVGFGDISDDRISGAISLAGGIDSFSQGKTIKADQHTVGAAAGGLLASNGARRSVLVKNMSSSDSVWIGHDVTVTVANGFEVEPGQVLAFDKAASAAFYAIGDVAGMDVRTLEELD